MADGVQRLRHAGREDGAGRALAHRHCAGGRSTPRLRTLPSRTGATVWLWQRLGQCQALGVSRSLVSAVVTAIVSRVLQVENWTMAAESFGEPMPALLLDPPEADRPRCRRRRVGRLVRGARRLERLRLAVCRRPAGGRARLWRIFKPVLLTSSTAPCGAGGGHGAGVGLGRRGGYECRGARCGTSERARRGGERPRRASWGSPGARADGCTGRCTGGVGGSLWQRRAALVPPRPAWPQPEPAARQRGERGRGARGAARGARGGRARRAATVAGRGARRCEG